LSYVPKSLLDLETKRLNEDVEKKAVSSKITKGEYISKRLGYKDHAAFEHELKKTAEKNLRLVVAIQKIIDDLKIEVSEKDLQAHFEKLAKVYGTSVDAIKQRLNNNFEGVETFILQEKTFDKLIELNK
jgi:FKBP-type peptidyl-prolyl cis-trans isomerase (trigger factor)